MLVLGRRSAELTEKQGLVDAASKIPQALVTRTRVGRRHIWWAKSATKRRRTRVKVAIRKRQRANEMHWSKLVGQAMPEEKVLCERPVMHIHQPNLAAGPVAEGRLLPIRPIKAEG